MHDMGQHSNLVAPKLSKQSPHSFQAHLEDAFFRPSNHSTPLPRIEPKSRL